MKIKTESISGTSQTSGIYLKELWFTLSCPRPGILGTIARFLKLRYGYVEKKSLVNNGAETYRQWAKQNYDR